MGQRETGIHRGSRSAAGKVARSLRGLSLKRADLKKRGHFGSGFSSDQYSWAYREAVSCIGREGAVLDWGCGNGHFSLFLLESGFRDVHGLAFEEPELLDVIRASGHAFTFHQASRADPVNLPYLASQFEVVFPIGVLEHVREVGGDELASLKEIWRILAPGGLFVCAHFPNRWSPIEFLARLWPGKYSHRFTYRGHEIRRMLKSSGFRLKKLNSYGMLPRNIFSGRLSWFGDWSMTRLILNGFDKGLSVLLAPFCQNYGFVAMKPQ